MSAIEHHQKSEIEAQPLHRIARVPIRVTSSRARWLLTLIIAVDIALTALYLASTLPEIRAMTPAGRLASLDFTVPANLPWSWGILKLYMVAAVCALMAYSYSGGQKPDFFWRFGAAVALLMAIAESARLHDIWAATVAPALLGADGDPGTSLLISRGGLLAIFYVAALSLFPARSRPAFVGLSVSAALMIIAEMGPPMVLVADWIAPIEPSSVVVAWTGGLRLLGESLMLGALWFGIRDIQAVSVRYVYRRESPFPQPRRT